MTTPRPSRFAAHSKAPRVADRRNGAGDDRRNGASRNEVKRGFERLQECYFLRKRLSLAVSPFARAWGTMVMAWWSPCRSREIVSAIGDRGHDPSKSIQIYPVEGVGGVSAQSEP
ncbi:hypothetical protein C5615_37640 [Burkholderia cepacia]|uniref:Uncharacterized protein n=1 Tax=Burkholderia cepacia TaxID=292 RepID=A0A2S8HYN7_BURCE|nr:hypothetical protein C5615_37640 [Burkholderia cepacia]